MKFIVKVLAEQIRESFAIWDRERADAQMYGQNARCDYITILRATVITNYGMLSSMYSNNVITFKQFKLLERYNDRIREIYRNTI